ncbi:uncharacterized protein CANTADRAFT_26597 [Suhomyces tanzawaensis NRRL Y-17324]|uniref:Uncharacterized protein n=1 Tax=Suhomyces tanzawaensis NRRL Y-17324 TaxID=984487 RepID=A0A1E4SGF2_9ASCO|nr:uncharacterized protein CANTADRAFT_26597 [Suhomyces tanzawaensis NRRL Y-17324]ODV78545.1 hypothetical protein CANTADRAFT_26597 [Suhomyces tanzawaensis NRRL Y-17324]
MWKIPYQSAPRKNFDVPTILGPQEVSVWGRLGKRTPAADLKLDIISNSDLAIVNERGLTLPPIADYKRLICWAIRRQNAPRFL